VIKLETLTISVSDGNTKKKKMRMNGDFLGIDLLLSEHIRDCCKVVIEEIGEIQCLIKAGERDFSFESRIETSESK
jgi:hypothetical protein